MAVEPFTFDVALKDGAAHRIALYAIDWERVGRAEQVEIVNADTGGVLDSRPVTAFGGGLYLAWEVRGHVFVRVTNTGPYNAVVSALFFDRSSAPRRWTVIVRPAIVGAHAPLAGRRPRPKLVTRLSRA
jgi:hypothetical protein